MADGSEIETDAPAEDPLPLLSLRVVETPGGKQTVRVMHADFALGELPVSSWSAGAKANEFGELTVTVPVETADIYGGYPRATRARDDPDAR